MNLTFFRNDMTNCTIHTKGAMDFAAWKERTDTI